MMRRLSIVAAGMLSPVAAAVVSPLAAAGIAVLAAVRLSGVRGTTLQGSSSTVAFTPAVALGSGLLATTAASFGHRRSAAVMAAGAATL
ncbi:MAG: hypothetical protein Q7T55_22405, partial [Solirubrobacteraceae bacterium]|nr:hypothetical protein [Solirubrobacteraceae bacterium]